MTILKALFVCLLLWAMPLPAQTGPAQPTIFQTIFSAITTTQASNPVRNIGQSYHQITLTFANQSGKTCVPGAAANFGDIGFEQSSDNVTYYRVGPRMGAPGSTFLTGSYMTLTTQGAWPYMRVNARAFDTTNCALTVTYTGTISPLTAPPAQFAGYYCTASATLTASGANTILGSVSASTAIVIDKLTIWNSGATQTGTGISVGCSSATGSFNLPGFPTLTGYSYAGATPLQRCADNTVVSVTLAVTGAVDVYICFHYE